MTKVWTADAAFWGLIRDKEVLGKIVGEVAGSDVAAANAGEKAAVLKTIVTDHLDGTGGRAKVEAWVPRWLKFEPSPYTARGGVGSVNARDRLLHILARAAEAAARSKADAAEGESGDADPDADEGDEARDKAAPFGDDGKGGEGDDGDETPLAA